MSQVNDFMYTHSKVIGENKYLMPEIISTIKGNDNTKCVSQDEGKLIINDCPPSLSDYTDKYYFRYKNKILSTLDNINCLSYDNNGSVILKKREDYEQGLTNCIPINIAKDFVIETGDKCLTFQSNDCKKDSFKLDLS
jgi:hypothetical protein